MNFVICGLLLIAVAISLLLFNKYADELKVCHFKLLFLCIVLLGFILRILSVVFIQCEPVSDYYAMFSAAQSVSEGGRPFTMGSYFQRFPHITTFPVVCGLLMKIFGNSVIVIKVFNVLFKTCAIFAAGLIGKELYGKRGMLSAAFLYSVFPPDIFYTPVIATENFALTFLLFSLLFYIKAYKSENNITTAKNAAVCGLILSVGCLFRGVAPFYLAAYFAGIVFVFNGIKRKLISMLAILTAYVVIFQTVSLSLYYGGITEYKLSDKGEPYVVYMLVGSNFETSGMYSAEDHGVYLDAGQNPELASEIATEKLIKRLSENKEKIIPLMIKKTDIIWSDASFNSVYWSMYENGINVENSFAHTAMSVCRAVYRFLLVMTAIAIIFYKKRSVTFMLALLPLAFEGGLMLMEIQPRYTFSVAYIFTIFATIGVCVIFDYFKKRRVV